MGVLLELGVVVARAQDGDLVVLGLLALDDVCEILELVVPSQPRGEKWAERYWVHEIRHVGDLNGGGQLGDDVGAVDDRQVDLGAGLLFPRSKAVDDRLVLGFVKALAPPNRELAGGLGRSRARDGGSRRRTKARDGTTAGNLGHGLSS